MATSRHDHSRALAVLGAACGVRGVRRGAGAAPDPDLAASAAVWLETLAPYPPAEVSAAVQDLVSGMTESYGRLPPPGAVVERIRAARARAAMQAHRERERRRTALRADGEALRRAALDKLRSDIAAAKMLPPAEAREARAQALAEHAVTVTAIVAGETRAALALALEPDVPALAGGREA